MIANDKEIEKEISAPVAIKVAVEDVSIAKAEAIKIEEVKAEISKAEAAKAEAIKLEAAKAQVLKAEVAIPVIELAKEEDEIESLPIVLESFVFEEIAAEEKILAELKEVSPDVKTRRAQWIEKLKQRLASYKEKKRSFEDSKKERNELRAERKKIRVELTEAKELATKNCAVSKNKKKADSISDQCLKSQAQVAELEKNDQKLTEAIKDLKNSLESKKLEAHEDLKLVREAQASLKLIKIELKLAAKT